MKILVGLLFGALSVLAQDWVPARIVAIAEYVPVASAARVHGDVKVKCTLDANGRVVNATVLSGHPLLKEQARQNALLWKFKSSSPQVSNSVTLTYQYRLEGELQDLSRTNAHTVFIVDLPNTIQIIAPPNWVMP